jgi:C-terminal processing protease CtpA/Prc
MGEANWDYELFRALPSVLEAPNREGGRRAISGWISRFGEPEPCAPCVQPVTDPVIAADIDWIRDRELLGGELSEQLQRIYERRPPDGDRYYAAQPTQVANPDFSNEAAYPASLPDAGYRLLAVYRFWNIIEYWFPYRDLLDTEWERVLEEFVPRVLDVQSDFEYQRVMMELIAQVDDTHANLWSHMAVQPPVGTAQLPVVTRFVEGQAVVTGYSSPQLGPESGLRIGDVIEEIDGRSVSSLVSEWSRFYSASNEPTRLRDIARNLTRGSEGEVRISGTRAGGDFELTAERVSLRQLDAAAGRTHDLPGPTFQRLSDEVAYLKLSSVAAADVPEYLAGAEGADVLVVDIRNYPSEFVVFALGGHFVTERTRHAMFSQGDLANPGAFYVREPVALQPLEPHFGGTVAILVDETSLSQAEYTAMALRAGPNAFVAGSTTAGADGNVSPIPLPGGLRSMISGIGVFYPDGTPTQRVGIVPDLEMRPTVEGIRDGRDEVLEAAVSRALGREWRMDTR